MFDLKPKTLALEINRFGYKAIPSPKNPVGICIIPSIGGSHHDVLIKKAKRGGFKVIFKDLLIGQVVSFVAVKSLDQVKEILNKS
tara:strand:- start:401 stop:655 length:255 start_codon:yes stop_codon:yes gene_type:complete